MMKKIIFLCFFIGSIGFFSTTIKAQSNDSARLQFSILTCEAGEDIYTVWGHTAIRVIDSTHHTDYVFNYGTFDFDEPFFITKFVKGSLKYFISVNNFSDFYNLYQAEKRNIKEQVINLSITEKAKWYEALKVNLVDSNRYYLYNFITDNCTTRVKDGLFKNTHYQPNPTTTLSFREKVVAAPYQKGIPWIGLGIDLLLGAYSDQKPLEMHAGFLPDLLFDQLAQVKKLVKSTHVYQFTTASENANTNTKSKVPFFTLLGFLAFYLILTIVKNRFTIIASKIVDIALLLTFTIGGSLMFYMCHISLHTACYQNFNLMWMHPLYLIALITYFIKNQWIESIAKVFLGAIIGLLLACFWLPQHFSQEIFLLIAIALILNYRLILKGQNNIATK